MKKENLEKERMNEEKLEQFINYLTKSVDLQYKSALYIVLKQCIEEVGLEKNKLIKRIKDMYKIQELNNLENISLINKQFLKKFVILDEKSRISIIDKLVKDLEDLKSENEIINIPDNNIPDQKKQKLIKHITKDHRITLNLLPEYRREDFDKFKFYAKYNNLHLGIRAYYYEQREKYDERDEKIYYETYNDKLLNSYINFFNNNIENLKIFKEKTIENKEIRNYKFYDGQYKKITTIEYTGTDANTKKELYFVLSTIEFNQFDKALILVIQHCNFEDYEKYHNLMHENLYNISYNVPNDEFEIKINDKELGKIMIVDGVVTGKKINFGKITRKFKIPTSLEFSFEIINFDRADFIENEDKYINNLKSFLSSKDEITNKIFDEILSHCGNYEKNRCIQIDISANVYIYEDDIFITCPYSFETVDDDSVQFLDLFFNCKNKTIQIC